jgi:DNA-directed RNA polymerase subunit L
MKRLILIILLVNFAGNFYGQDIKVTAGFDTSRIFIGDQIFFTVKIEKPVEANLSFPVFKDTLYKKIEIISGPDTDTILLNSIKNIISQKYLVTSFDSGLYQVPPVYAELITENGLKRFYSNYSKLEVLRITSAPQDTTDVIYDIIKPYKAPLTIGDILPWVLLLIVFSLIVWYIIRLIKNRKRRKPGEDKHVITEPAHVIAFRELEKLRNEELWQKGEVKLYHTRLTEILRQYLDNRYNISSMELTTDETLSIYYKTVKPDVTLFNSLKSILINADLVKFAKFKPDPSDNETAFENSWGFINVTLVKPEVAEEKAKKTGEEEKE